MAISGTETDGSALELSLKASGIEVKSARRVQAAVYSISGLLMQHAQLEAGTNIMNISSLPKGIYVLRASDGQTTKGLKFAK